LPNFLILTANIQFLGNMSNIGLDNKMADV